LRSDIIKDVKKDFSTYKKEIIEDIEQNILARYLPDSMLIERGLKNDVQVEATAKLLKDGKEFDKILPNREELLVEKSDTINKNADAINKNGGQNYEITSTLKPAPSLQSRW